MSVWLPANLRVEGSAKGHQRYQRSRKEVPCDIYRHRPVREALTIHGAGAAMRRYLAVHCVNLAVEVVRKKLVVLAAIWIVILKQDF
jgi:hypothetical protein